ncbi:MAG: hypothetical protein U0670_06740 [Anaerolineae bacterium]
MTYFPEDLNEDPEARREARREFLDIEEDEQIAEGDISVSETVSGHDPLPEVDDRDLEGDVLGDPDLSVLDEDDPELGFGYEDEDAYLTESPGQSSGEDDRSPKR